MKIIESNIGFEKHRLAPETPSDRGLLAGWVKLHGVARVEEDDTSGYWRLPRWRWGSTKPCSVASVNWDDLRWGENGIGWVSAYFDEYPFNPLQSLADSELVEIQIIVEVDEHGALMHPTWIIGDQKNCLPYTPSFPYLPSGETSI